MRKMSLKIVLSIGLLFAFASLFSQKSTYKYGKISNEELTMRVYPKDTSAVALVLMLDGFTRYEFINNDFRVETDVCKRIKIFKKDGLEYATVTLPYYRKSYDESESIFDIEAFSYNLENGKVVKTKLEKKYIYDEEVSTNRRQLKFAIPNVKEGSIIEYKYTMSSNMYYDMPDWKFQSSIPLLYGRYEVKIPEYFEYHVEGKGYEKMKVQEKPVNESFTINYGSGQTQSVECSATETVYIVDSIPGLEDDKYLWNVNDFLSGLRFELMATRFPNSFYKPYTRSWEDVEKTIKENTSFNSYINIKNPFAKEVAQIVSEQTDENVRMEMIYSLIKKKIKWNESYAFISAPADAISKGTGNNAQINAVLISALKDAGFKSYPVLISRRSRGRLPLTFPSIDQLNTFIVAAQATDGKIFYMDGSAYYGGLNVLPADLLVDRGRTYKINDVNDWVDLTGLSKNLRNMYIFIDMDEKGQMKGKIVNGYKNLTAYNFKKKVSELNDSLKYIENISKDYSIIIDSLQFRNIKNPVSNSVDEIITFHKENEVSGDFIYFNPMIISHILENDFKQTDRKLPVEFSYPYIYQLNVQLKLPQNYVVDEMPKSEKYTMDNNSGTMQYIVQKNDSLILLRYRFELNQTVFPYTDYPMIRDFYGKTVEKNNEMLVLKKVKL